MLVAGFLLLPSFHPGSRARRACGGRVIPASPERSERNPGSPLDPPATENISHHLPGNFMKLLLPVVGIPRNDLVPKLCEHLCDPVHFCV